MMATSSRPDFSGVWELNFERSILRGPAPQRILMMIDHREPHLSQRIHYVDAGGAEQRVTFRYETGAETTNSVGESIARTRARWEGLELVIESRLKTPERDFHFRDHWSLSDDGRTLTMAHRDDDLAGQITVLEKRSPADATGFGRHATTT
jgi:hypothetical protein